MSSSTPAATTSSSIAIQWTPKAQADVAAFTSADFGGENPTTFHERKVQEHYNNNQTTLQGTVKAKIRYVLALVHALLANSFSRGAHAGGTDPNEPDHITVSYKDAKNKDVGGGGVHVYTGR